jgi:rod shape-determining protein MreC
VVVFLNLPLPASLRIEAGARDAVAPFQNVLTLLGNKGRGFFRLFSADALGLGERQRLLTEIAELRYQLDQTEFLRRDNEELRRLVDFRRQQTRNLQLCEVIARGDVGGWWQTVTVNKGSDEGIALHSPVITTRGLVGRITSVSRLTSVVLLITDPGCRVSCRVAGSDAFGVVAGTGVAFNRGSSLEMLAMAEPLTMSYVSLDYEIRPGDSVVTSGLGGVFPEGLVVGHILRSVTDASSLHQRMMVAPAAKLAALRYVFVIGK